MQEWTIKALLSLETVDVGGIKYIQIPYEDILRGNVDIRLMEKVSLVPPVPKIETPAPTGLSISIPEEIQKLYPASAKDKMAQDVMDYLKVIARCWEFKGLSFQPSILKKAAKEKPALNGIIFTAYGKEGDKYLTALVKDNISSIRQYWDEAAT